MVGHTPHLHLLQLHHRSAILYGCLHDNQGVPFYILPFLRSSSQILLQLNFLIREFVIISHCGSFNYFNSPAGLQHDVLPHLPIAVLLHHVNEPVNDGVSEHGASGRFESRFYWDIDFSLVLRSVPDGVNFLPGG